MSETKTNENTSKLVEGAMETELISPNKREFHNITVYTYSIPICSTFIYRWDQEGNEAFNSRPHPLLNSLLKEISAKIKLGEIEKDDKSKSVRLGIFENIILLGFPSVKPTITEETKLRDSAKSVLTAMITELKKGLAGIEMRIDEEVLTDPIKRRCLKNEIIKSNLIWIAKR